MNMHSTYFDNEKTNNKYKDMHTLSSFSFKLKTKDKQKHKYWIYVQILKLNLIILYILLPSGGGQQLWYLSEIKNNKTTENKRNFTKVCTVLFSYFFFLFGKFLLRTTKRMEWLKGKNSTKCHLRSCLALLSGERRLQSKWRKKTRTEEGGLSYNICSIYTIICA